MDRTKFIKSSLALAAITCIKTYAVEKNDAKKALVVFFSWSGNTRAIAGQIAKKISADTVELSLEKPYSTKYNTCLDEALNDQKKQARPTLKNNLGVLSKYDTIFLGYPNWWASIPMPIASFLESYDFKGKMIIPFCSNGGGGLGQSVSAISKLCPNSEIKDALSISYAGGRSLTNEIDQWLAKNGIK